MGRANALRLALAGEQPIKRAPPGRWVRDVLDLCLMCKACKSECPSNVDMAKLKADFLQLYYAGRFRPLNHWLLAQTPRLYRWGAPVAPVVNWLQENVLVRWFLHHLAGIERRRSLPPLHSDHLRHWFPRHTPGTRSGPGRLRKCVVLLDDCFTTYNEPQIGRAAVRVLREGRLPGQIWRTSSVAAGRSSAKVIFGRPGELVTLAGAIAFGVACPKASLLLGLEPEPLADAGGRMARLGPLEPGNACDWPNTGPPGGGMAGTRNQAEAEHVGSN